MNNRFSYSFLLYTDVYTFSIAVTSFRICRLLSLQKDCPLEVQWGDSSINKGGTVEPQCSTWNWSWQRLQASAARGRVLPADVSLFGSLMMIANFSISGEVVWGIPLNTGCSLCWWWNKSLEGVSLSFSRHFPAEIDMRNLMAKEPSVSEVAPGDQSCSRGGWYL